MESKLFKHIRISHPNSISVILSESELTLKPIKYRSGRNIISSEKQTRVKLNKLILLEYHNYEYDEQSRQST